MHSTSACLIFFNSRSRVLQWLWFVCNLLYLKITLSLYGLQTKRRTSNIIKNRSVIIRLNTEYNWIQLTTLDRTICATCNLCRPLTHSLLTAKISSPLSNVPSNAVGPLSFTYFNTYYWWPIHRNRCSSSGVSIAGVLAKFTNNQNMGHTRIDDCYIFRVRNVYIFKEIWMLLLKFPQKDIL